MWIFNRGSPNRRLFLTTIMDKAQPSQVYGVHARAEEKEQALKQYFWLKKLIGFGFEALQVHF